MDKNKLNRVDLIFNFQKNRNFINIHVYVQHFLWYVFAYSVHLNFKANDFFLNFLIKFCFKTFWNLRLGSSLYNFNFICIYTDVIDCVYGGKKYKSGQHFNKGDNCNTCVCANTGDVRCTDQACAMGEHFII